MERRRFFRMGALSAAAAAFAGKMVRGMERIREGFELESSDFWTGSYFRQRNVDTTRLPLGEVRARIGGVWETYRLRAFDDGFFDWNRSDRLRKLEAMAGGTMPDWSGSHNAAVATVGKNRGDSRFTLNNAIKGTGLCPREERLDGLLRRLEETREMPAPEKFGVLRSLYEDRSVWDRTRLVSLELYAAPDFETHTFLNQMENPVSSIVYLDIPSYELRAIARLIHPADPECSEYERKIAAYINGIHTYVHSQFRGTVPAVVYYIVEEFDNSPAGRGGRGKKGARVV